MAVKREDLEAHLDILRTEIRDPRQGLYGPGTASWRIGREAIVFLGGGRAALLQLAHPFVAHAIEQHSRTKIDLVGRFQRTFLNIYSMVFGSLDHALRSARRVHAYHSTIKGDITEDIGRYRQGSPYQANDEEALLWVHATLVDTAILIYDQCVRKLDERERDQYWQESRRFARLFGIPDDVFPSSWASFRRFFDGMLVSDKIKVGRPAKEMADFLLSPPTPLHAPAMQGYRIITAGLLPARLRNEYGFSHGVAKELAFRALLRSVSAGYPLLPKRLRYVPAYIEARSRLADKAEPDRVGRTIERYALKWLAPPRRG